MKGLLLYDTMDLPETKLLIELCKNGLSAHVIYNPSGANHHLLKDLGITLTPLVCKNKLDLKAIMAIRKIILEEDLDFVQAFTSRLLSAAILATAFLKKWPKILAYRGAIGNIKKSDPTSWLSFLNPRVVGISCVSKAVEDDLASAGVPRKKLKTIHKGHNLAWYRAAPRAALKEFGIAENDFVVACTANIRKTKGIDLLIEAAREINKQMMIYFLIIGKIKDPAIVKLAEGKYSQKFIQFIGYREDASSLVGACDVFALPSRDREGLPKAVIEAMALGIPCVVSDVGGMPELIRDGVDGIVVEKENAAKLAEAIKTLYYDKDKRAAFGKSARARIEQEFNIETTLKQTLEFYSLLTSGS